MNTEQRALADLVHVLELEVHAAELLPQELAGARRALVARVGVHDAAAAVQHVDHEVLAAHRDHRAWRERRRLERALDADRRNDLRQRDPVPAFIAGHDAFERNVRRQGQGGEETLERAPEIALVRQCRLGHAAIGFSREHTELERGGADVDSKRLFGHGGSSWRFGRERPARRSGAERPRQAVAEPRLPGNRLTSGTPSSRDDWPPATTSERPSSS
jgi:hypothetical protein